MKLIEAMKEVKRLEEQVSKTIQQIKVYCADLDFETPTYPDQAKQIQAWEQSVHDSLRLAEELRTQIQRTNLATLVTIELGGRKVEKSIANWIIRRRIYATIEESAWASLTDRGLKEGRFKTSAGEEREVKIRRYFRPQDRDTFVAEFHDEPNLIDRTLEVVNAVTDLVK